MQAGFTLVEVLVVVGLVTLLLGATLFFDVQGYRSDAFRAERTKLVTALQTAEAAPAEPAASPSEVALPPRSS